MKGAVEMMNVPLAEQLRPKTVEEMVGQRHLLAEGKALRRIIDSGEVPNLVFYGPELEKQPLPQ